MHVMGDHVMYGRNAMSCDVGRKVMCCMGVSHVIHERKVMCCTRKRMGGRSHDT